MSTPSGAGTRMRSHVSSASSTRACAAWRASMCRTPPWRTRSCRRSGWARRLHALAVGSGYDLAHDPFHERLNPRREELARCSITSRRLDQVPRRALPRRMRQSTPPPWQRGRESCGPSDKSSHRHTTHCPSKWRDDARCSRRRCRQPVIRKPTPVPEMSYNGTRLHSHLGGVRPEGCRGADRQRSDLDIGWMSA